ncbi:MAG: TIGR04211 family SH3 domain-containing protein [Woeseiaceae bacterium]|nr:TIGR04211 family SH3 domain-containing protein [Woeseiaceae bacterium]
MFRFNLALGAFILLFANTAAGQTAWVSDEFEIMLRTGPSTSNAIQLMVSSGTELEVLERDEESGFTRVRTGGGTEGWVLTRYLMSEPSAREQLEALTSQLTDAASEGASLESQLAAIRGEYAAAERQITSLESENTRLERELADIRRTAADVLAINDQNEEFRLQLVDSDIRVETLEQQNRELTSQTTRYWFMTGALVLVVGIILGLWLPRIRWQRRSRYDRF